MLYEVITSNLLSSDNWTMTDAQPLVQKLEKIEGDIHLRHLQALTDIPRKMGMAAKATIGDLVYALLVANPKLATDSKMLFHADHNNLLATALSVDALDAVEMKIGFVVDPPHFLGNQ